MNLRTVTCDIKGCVERYTENQSGDGFPGWGQLNGIALNGVDNPYLCPEHLHKISEFADSLEIT